MEASAYAWIIILIFFVVYATIQLRKCFDRILSSRGNTPRLDETSSNSVYTIENDMRGSRSDREICGAVGAVDKNNDGLPTYEQVMQQVAASDNGSRLPAFASLDTTDTSTSTPTTDVVTTSASISRQ